MEANIRAFGAASLLRTYSTERRAIAQDLIDFDREWATMFSASPKAADDADGDGVDPVEFQKYFMRKARFTAGVGTRYRPSILTAEPTHQALAKGFEIGMRFHSAPAIRLADAKPVQLGHAIKADGRWRLFVFAEQGALRSEYSGRDAPLCSRTRERHQCDALHWSTRCG